jgi:hypothetical protein
MTAEHVSVSYRLSTNLTGQSAISVDNLFKTIGYEVLKTVLTVFIY